MRAFSLLEPYGKYHGTDSACYLNDRTKHVAVDSFKPLHAVPCQQQCNAEAQHTSGYAHEPNQPARNS